MHAAAGVSSCEAPPVENKAASARAAWDWASGRSAIQAVGRDGSGVRVPREVALVIMTTGR